jgi:hypothetical protein
MRVYSRTHGDFRSRIKEIISKHACSRGILGYNFNGYVCLLPEILMKPCTMPLNPNATQCDK